MKTTIKEIKKLIREALETVRQLSREQAIAWLARWLSGGLPDVVPTKGNVNSATRYVDEQQGANFKLIRYPDGKDDVLLATDTMVLDPYGDPAGWVPLESFGDSENEEFLRAKAMQSLEDYESQDGKITKRVCLDVVKHYNEMLGYGFKPKQIKAIALDLYGDLTGHQSDEL